MSNLSPPLAELRRLLGPSREPGREPRHAVRQELADRYVRHRDLFAGRAAGDWDNTRGKLDQ